MGGAWLLCCESFRRYSILTDLQVPSSKSVLERAGQRIGEDRSTARSKFKLAAPAVSMTSCAGRLKIGLHMWSACPSSLRAESAALPLTPHPRCVESTY